MDLALAGMALRPGTVLDGEAVIWHDGRLDFAAVQARAASSVDRSRVLAARLPASYAVWDVLAHPDHGDVRGRRYTERRRLLLDLLADLGPPIQPVPATDDYETARVWCETLRAQGIEGIVCKRADGPADHPDRERRYPSDMTDAEWAAVRPLLPVPAWLNGRGGRPRVTATASCWTRSATWSRAGSPGGRCPRTSPAGAGSMPSSAAGASTG
ncbi:DNA ligase [Streptomyces sp. AVP053U2]|nr:DNA ligase [Streptomyces sp. AVP053U2]